MVFLMLIIINIRSTVQPQETTLEEIENNNKPSVLTVMDIFLTSAQMLLLAKQLNMNFNVK